MFYVKLNNDGTVKHYPYTLADLRLANPGTSFPQQIGNETAAEFNVFPVAPTAPPAADYIVNLERNAVKQGSEWVEEWIETPATSEQIQERLTNQWGIIRSERNDYLAACDWTQLPDSPADKTAWALYRQQLRDITEQSNPFEIVWPVAP